MIADTTGLMQAVRDRFAHIETCPFEGPRIFFENAGGALTLKSVVETSATYAALPDNQGRDNPASAAMMAAIDKGRADMREFLNAPRGQVFVGESGTEILFRLVRTAALAGVKGGAMLAGTLEHPASRSAMTRWAEVTGRPLRMAVHDDATGTIGPEAYRPHLSSDLRVASIIHTSPVTGMRVDVAEIAAEIRAAAPECFIVVDGIQHASHGSVDLAAMGVDGYAISPYKMFSRHGYGMGWASDRLSAQTKETVIGGPAESWEQGTRDAGAYATFSDVVAYFRWLGGHFTDSRDGRDRIEAAAGAIHAQEQRLARTMLEGTGNLPGLAEMAGIHVIGGTDNPLREGVVSLWLEGMAADRLVAHLRAQGIRTHIRKDDHYSGNVLGPLGLEACVRVSFSHYNTEGEVAQFLAAMKDAL